MSREQDPGDVPLKLRHVSRHFGSLRAVDDVSFRVHRGERRALIGPNGAGKSTLLNLISGHAPVTSGEIEFLGQSMAGVSEDERCRRGLAKTFQHSSLFDGLTAWENVALAARQRLGIANRPFRRANNHSQLGDIVAESLDVATLALRGQVLAGALSHGERRQLEIAMALATNPALLLFDEPVAGMSQAETDRFVESVGALPRELTVVIVEHDMDVVFALAERVTVLHAGRLLADGTPGEISSSVDVQEAYLGTATTSELFTS